MAQVTTASQPSPTWVQRLYDLAPIAPGWVGLGIALGLWASYFAVEWALGREVLHVGGDFLAGSQESVVTLFLCAALGYVCTAYVSVIREAPRSVAELRPLLAGESHELLEIERRAASFPRGSLFVFGVLGLAIGLGIPYLERGPTWDPYAWRLWTPESTWHRFLGPALGWWIARLFAVMIASSRRLSTLADRIATIDLLDLTRLAPFARKGLANTFWLAGLVAFVSLMLLDAPRYGGVIVLLVGFTLAAASVGMLLPVRGIHRRIRDAKRGEIDRVNAAIRGDASAIGETALAARADPVTIADLVAYRKLVEDVREWPLGASTVFRFTLYLLIPVGSWAGGAIAERVVDSLLD